MSYRRSKHFKGHTFPPDLHHGLLALAVGVWAGACAATSPVPYYFECRTVDRIFQTALKEPHAQREALEALKLIGTGRIDSANPNLEVHIGLTPGELRATAFRAPTVRAHAFRKLGETALPDAIAFLESLKASDLAADTTGMVWPAALIALRDGRLRGISDPAMQTRFLEQVVAGPHDALSNSAVTSWAVDELCDRGSFLSPPIIQNAIRRALSGQSGEDDVEFCEQRIRAVTSDPDRVKAVASVLDMQRDIGDVQRRLTDPRRRLIGWAVRKLNSMQSAAADAELDRFARQIEALPEGSRKAAFAEYRLQILDLQAQRALK